MNVTGTMSDPTLETALVVGQRKSLLSWLLLVLENHLGRTGDNL